MAFSSRIACGLFNVSQGTYEHEDYLWDGTYRLWFLSENTWKSNHLRMKLQRQHSLLNYFKNQCWSCRGSNPQPPAWEPDSQPNVSMWIISDIIDISIIVHVIFM